MSLPFIWYYGCLHTFLHFKERLYIFSLLIISLVSFVSLRLCSQHYDWQCYAKKNKENIYNWDAATKLAFYVATGNGRRVSWGYTHTHMQTARFLAISLCCKHNKRTHAKLEHDFLCSFIVVVLRLYLSGFVCVCCKKK